MTTFRTYETFEIRWIERRSTWTGYDSAAEAQAVIDGSPAEGVVVRRTFEVEIRPGREHLYRPGISERVA